MDMPDIHHQLLIAAPAEKIYHAITSREGLAAWWTPAAIATPEVNSIAHFPFGPDYYKDMRVTTLKPFEEVGWTCIKGALEWIGTSLSFRIQPFDRGTLLNAHDEMGGQLEQLSNSDSGSLLIFHHDDWKAYTPMFAECNYTWGQFLRSLKLLCETGKGRPWPHQHTV
ncbi:SRPBCC domain-containing protein [Chitinophaga barathri]|uniref:SRPBCC domain-containing protein n=2 Tax=Chitinophaga barathri TaxID=1647451 RepID=A0A3N4M7Q2_9BACT|nr:SRPBCC domain-containing protein [Chitinophaga barathri]